MTWQKSRQKKKRQHVACSMQHEAKSQLHFNALNYEGGSTRLTEWQQTRHLAAVSCPLSLSHSLKLFVAATYPWLTHVSTSALLATFTEKKRYPPTTYHLLPTTTPLYSRFSPLLCCKSLALHCINSLHFSKRSWIDSHAHLCM